MRVACIALTVVSLFTPSGAFAATAMATMGVRLTIVAPCDPRVGGSGCHAAPVIVSTRRSEPNAPSYFTIRPPSVVAPGVETTTY